MSGEAIARAVLLLAAAACAVVDLRERRIPDAIVLPAFALAAAARIVAAARGGGWTPLLEGIGTGAAAFAALRLVRLASRGRLGPGDAKLSALMGFVLGPKGWLVGMLAASATGTAVALVLLASGRIRRGDPLAFAPFLAAGAAVALLLERVLEAGV